MLVCFNLYSFKLEIYVFKTVQQSKNYIKKHRLELNKSINQHLNNH